MKASFCRILLLCVLASVAPQMRAAETVGTRPYEMVWANRDKDIYPPLVDFENLSGWKVETKNTTASFESSREQQLWGNYVGKLTYRANANSASEIRLLPPAPIPVSAPWDAISCWIYGNNIRGEAGTPQVFISAIFVNEKGAEVPISLTSVHWKEWFVPYHVLSDAENQQLAGKVFFNGFRITGGTNLSDRVLYFDNFATFQDSKAPLKIPARPKRGIEMLPGESSGFKSLSS
jgi:hypothetical protein